ncbi:MAG: hypothetical protein ACOX9R_14380 [Armatimonadota bacterium]|jgi:hypothetical protein
MARLIPATLALILLTCAAFAASVHVRSADGTWVEIQASEQDGTVGFTVTPEETDSGTALVVINKPDWMVLADDAPPAVVSYQVAGRIFEVESPDEPLVLSGLGEDADGRRVTFSITDDANPIDVRAARLRIDGRPALQPEVVEDDREARSAKLTIDLNDFGPGAWQGALEVPDLSPMGNTLSIPLQFSIAGAQIAESAQSATLSGGGAGFTVRGHNRQTVAVDAADVAAFLSLQPGTEKHLYVRRFAGIEDLGAEAGWHRVEATVELQDIDGKPVTDEEVGVSLRMRFAVHNDIPAIVVTSTAVNLAETRPMYAFWGWLPGDGYVTSDGRAHEWSMNYGDVNPDGWVLLPAMDSRPGVGWISDGDFGQSRFGTMLLYTDPQKPRVATGDAVVSTFALMPATEIDEVAEVAARLSEAGALQPAGQ